jgi:hypothetical protein
VQQRLSAQRRAAACPKTPKRTQTAPLQRTAQRAAAAAHALQRLQDSTQHRGDAQARAVCALERRGARAEDVPFQQG